MNQLCIAAYCKSAIRVYSRNVSRPLGTKGVGITGKEEEMKGERGTDRRTEGKGKVREESE